MNFSRPPLQVVVDQLAEDLNLLIAQRTALVRSPAAGLRKLGLHDERIEAHLQALVDAWPAGERSVRVALERASAAAAFSVVALALERGALNVLGEVATLATEAPQLMQGVLGALGWVDVVSKEQVQLSAFAAAMGHHAPRVWLAAHRLQRCRPPFVEMFVADGSSKQIRLEAVRLVGELGAVDLLPQCRSLLGAEDVQLVQAAAVSCAYLGEADLATAAIARLRGSVSGSMAEALRADLTASQVASLRGVQAAAGTGDQAATDTQSGQCGRLRRAGLAGGLACIPELVESLSAIRFARAAAEAFTWITGADLEDLGLDRDPPDDFQSGPNDDPNDENVAMDEDEDLPWPDPVKVADWWHKNKHNFQPGVRYFMGKPVTVEHCIHVLKTGKQRQRFIAARYLKLLQPERPLFNCAAPAWRQQALLAKM